MKARNSKKICYLSLQIKTQTWSRDSYGLFDYENHKVKSTTLFINESGSVLRKKNDIKFYKTSEIVSVQMNQGEDSELSKVSLKESNLIVKIRQILFD